MHFLLRRLFAVVIGFTAAVAAAAPVTVEDILRIVKQPDVLTADFTLEKKTPAVTVMLKSRGRLVLSKEKGLLWIFIGKWINLCMYLVKKRYCII